MHFQLVWIPSIPPKYKKTIKRIVYFILFAWASLSILVFMLDIKIISFKKLLFNEGMWISILIWIISFLLCYKEFKEIKKELKKPPDIIHL